MKRLFHEVNTLVYKDVRDLFQCRTMMHDASSSLNQLRKAWPFSVSPVAMVMYAMTDFQYQAVYNTLSFSLASMMATTMFLWFRSFAVTAQFQSAVIIFGLVTVIAAYHYIRIFNSWVEAY